MISIPLTRGHVALIDDIDADLANLKWRSDGTQHYAVRYAGGGRAQPAYELMHRVILERILCRPLEKGEEVDHINVDGFDNRRSNIRLANSSQNKTNRKLQKSNTSGFKGVSPHGKRWVATISINNKTQYLGIFDTPEQAYAAYCEAAKKQYGEFARLD